MTHPPATACTPATQEAPARSPVASRPSQPHAYLVTPSCESRRTQWKPLLERAIATRRMWTWAAWGAGGRAAPQHRSRGKLPLGSGACATGQLRGAWAIAVRATAAGAAAAERLEGAHR
jgi:hypothetical protein